MTSNQPTKDTGEIPTIKTAPLGHLFTTEEVKRQCRTTIGAVAWPGKCPGFAVVLAVTGSKKEPPYEIHLLDEAESGDLKELIHKCNALDLRYTPERWIGDNQKKAAEKIIAELVATRQPRNEYEEPPRVFSGVYCSSLMDMDDTFYAYVMPTLRSALCDGNRKLFLKTSKVLDYLGQIKEQELPFLKRGDFPAVEALAYAAQEALDWIESDQQPRMKHYDPRPNDPMAF
jgi:hypothetical protein